jgi:hypothetical protein
MKQVQPSHVVVVCCSDLRVPVLLGSLRDDVHNEFGAYNRDPLSIAEEPTSRTIRTAQQKLTRRWETTSGVRNCC